jgi:hypothetical protein
MFLFVLHILEESFQSLGIKSKIIPTITGSKESGFELRRRFCDSNFKFMLALIL